MSTTTEKVVYEYQSKTSGFTKNVDKAEKSNNSLLSSVDKWKVAGVAGAVGITKMVYSASDLNESLNVVDSVFKGNSKTIVDWSKTAATSMGLSQTTALKTAGTFGAMGSSMGIPLDQITKMSMKLTGLSADLASFYNISQESAAGALKGIFTGETESLKNMGIMIDTTTLKQYGYSDSMSQSEKIMVRYRAVMDQTKNAQGDFKKTSDSLANATRTMLELFSQLTTNIGGKLIPVFQKVIKVINKGLLLAIQLTSGEINENLIRAFDVLTQYLIGALPIILGIAGAIIAIVGPATIFTAIMGILTPILSALAGAFALVGGAVVTLFSPMTLLIIAIAVLIGLIVRAGIAQGVWAKVIAVLGQILSLLGQVVIGVVGAMIKFIVTFIGAVASNKLLIAVASFLATTLGNLIVIVGNTVKIVLNAILSFINWAKQSKVVQAGIQALGNIVGFLVGIVGGLIGIVVRIIAKFIEWLNQSGLLQLALTVIGTVIKGIITVISIILVSISKAIDSFTKWAASSTTLQGILATVKGAVAKISDAVSTMNGYISDAIDWFVNLGKSASDALSNIPFVGGLFGGKSMTVNGNMVGKDLQSALNLQNGLMAGMASNTYNNRSVTYNVHAQKVMSVMQAHREKVIFDQQGANLI